MSSTRLIRVRAENGPRFTAALVAAGFEAKWLGAGTAPTETNGGCADHLCCFQHPGALYAPGEWGSIRTTASGRRAHTVFALANVASASSAVKAAENALEKARAFGCGQDKAFADLVSAHAKWDDVIEEARKARASDEEVDAACAALND